MPKPTWPGGRGTDEAGPHPKNTVTPGFESQIGAVLKALWTAITARFQRLSPPTTSQYSRKFELRRALHSAVLGIHHPPLLPSVSLPRLSLAAGLYSRPGIATASRTLLDGSYLALHFLRQPHFVSCLRCSLLVLHQGPWTLN